MRVNRPAICRPRVPANRPVSSTSRPENTNVAGSRSAKYFSVSDTSAPARVARLMLWISSTSTRSTLVRAAVAHTALVTSVRFADRGAGSPKNRANSTATIRGVAAGDRDVDDGQPVPVGGVPPAGGQLVGAAELAERGGLAGARRAADDGTAAGGDLVPVELDQQPAGADDLPDDRGVHQRQAGVVVDPRLVVPGPLRRVQARQGCGVQEDRRGRLGVHEPPPPL